MHVFWWFRFLSHNQRRTELLALWSHHSMSVDTVCFCRSRAYNASKCRQIDGYKHSDKYCYFTPTNCSTYYINCRCYSYYSTSYSIPTCINMDGTYVNARCYYNTRPCPYYWYRGQCYNSFSSNLRSFTCPGVYEYNTGYCYYNI